MYRATAVTRWTVRLAGLIQITLGLTFWTGHALSFIPVHMIVGVVIVLGLWILAALGARAGAPAPLVVLAIGLGLVLPIYGVVHGRLLTGSLHWIVQVIHLFLGIGALHLADVLASYGLRRGEAMLAGDPGGTASHRWRRVGGATIRARR